MKKWCISLVRWLVAGWHSSSGMAISVSRHGSIAVDRVATQTPDRAKTSTRHVASLLAGSTLIGFGVTLLINARLGLSPYDVLLSVVETRVGISFGQAAWALSALFFSVAIALGQRPGLMAVVYVLLNGLAIDTISSLVLPPEAMAVRVLFVMAGMTSLISGISLVVHSGLTGGAFELLMNAGAERGYNPTHVRTSMELGVFIAGVALGGDFGPVTVVYALVVGLLMRTIRQAMADHRAGRATRLAGSTQALPTHAR